MRSIQHLSLDEQAHYILCDCGEYVDMRSLDEVFMHVHSAVLPKAEWSYCRRKDEARIYGRNGERLDLN